MAMREETLIVVRGGGFCVVWPLFPRISHAVEFIVSRGRLVYSGSDGKIEDGNETAQEHLPSSLHRVLMAGSSCVQRLPPRNSQLWRFQIPMVTAQNCVHGSTLSPPRLAQLRETVLEHLAKNDASTDALFQL
eukprot:6055087-Pyramimonas_sp.AAC.1